MIKDGETPNAQRSIQKVLRVKTSARMTAALR